MNLYPIILLIEVWKKDILKTDTGQCTYNKAFSEIDKTYWILKCIPEWIPLANIDSFNCLRFLALFFFFLFCFSTTKFLFLVYWPIFLISLFVSLFSLSINTSKTIQHMTKKLYYSGLQSIQGKLVLHYILRFMSTCEIVLVTWLELYKVFVLVAPLKVIRRITEKVW